MDHNTNKCQVERDDVCYHHFTLTFDQSDIKTKLGEVRFVLVAGCARRAEAHANYLLESGQVFHRADSSVKLERLTRESSRFSLFKVGPILLANHGMGPASMSIALHELFLMCQQANIIDKITLLRFGTCGGIGVSPGTICITNRAFDPLFNEFVELKICLKSVKRSTRMDTQVAEELIRIQPDDESSMNRDRTSPRVPGTEINQTNNMKTRELEPPEDLGGKFEMKMGATIGTNDFYEEQGRTNGAICEHSAEDKRMFLEKAKEMGVINMEMESNYLAAMCNKLSVPFGVVCVALNNRLQDDRVLLNPRQMAQFERRLFWIISLFIRKRLSSMNVDK